MANRFIGTKVSKKSKFMGTELDINKLTVMQVLEIQESAKKIDTSNEKDNIDLLMFVVRAGAPELRDLTDEEICDFPMDELSGLSNEILKYSGLTTPASSK